MTQDNLHRARSVQAFRAAWLLQGLLLLSACGGGSDPQGSQAAASDISAGVSTPGTSPFIGFVPLTGTSVGSIAAVSYTIAPKPGSASKPVSVSYSIAALTKRGFAGAQAGMLRLPVFGLYDGYTNQVALSIRFADRSVQTLQLNVATAAYADPYGVYAHPLVNVPRSAGAALGFDFFVLKAIIGPPVVVDTDGAVRWVGPGTASSTSTAYQDNGFVVGDPNSNAFTRIEWDGATTAGALSATDDIGFHHNIDHGKSGMLGDLDTPVNVESTVVEFDDSGTVLGTWDLAALIGSYMRSQGDDPTPFVRPGADWFHLNASTFDPSDGTLIVSSRENFVVKVDYATGNIVWIFGDPTKYWYTFPSLRAKALTLQGGGLYPIGQHAVSITPDGLLMLFNDGAASFNNPPGTAAGASRDYSAVSAYRIDAPAGTAQQAWSFDHGMTIESSICSSVYAAADGSLLVDYADTNGGGAARLVGLDAAHAVVFDYQYGSANSCGTTWNAVPVPLDALQFD